MLIRAGYDISFITQQRVPMLANLSVHASRNKDLRTAQRIFTQPDVPLYDYRSEERRVGKECRL